jgi:signal transduction histidine kinase
MQTIEIGGVVRRAAGLETRMPINVEPGPDLTIEADGDQLEQVLINLIRNAVDASMETKGRVNARWLRIGSRVEIQIEDEGAGLANTSNLFVPFFTTKPEGSGIGLVLSRQIAEAHNGSLTLENKTIGNGCLARLSLPLSFDNNI